jgi:hypothetical protein
MVRSFLLQIREKDHTTSLAGIVRVIPKGTPKNRPANTPIHHKQRLQKRPEPIRGQIVQRRITASIAKLPEMLTKRAQKRRGRIG